MSSRRECFVYIQLPGTLDIVTCGRFEHTALPGGTGVGRFVYGRTYRARPDAVPIDPVHLPLSPRTYETAGLGGVFGAIRDGTPDAWGQLVIRRVLAREDLTAIDYLLESPEDRAGALSFGRGVDPPAPVRNYNRILQLEELRAVARLLEEGSSDAAVRAQILQVLQPTTSLGGVRPKNTVEDESGLWMAKFPSIKDRWQNAPVEAGMLRLARRCGIRVPDCRIEALGAELVLLTRRFDRERVDGGYLRHRMASALTMLDADDGGTDRSRWSYLLLADEMQRWSSRPRDDKAELFKRAVFNALTSNADDHPRNHAVVAAGSDWRLTPAYDLTPSLQSGGRQERDLSMICGAAGTQASRANLLSAARRFGLAVDDADTLIEHMKEVVASYWRADVLAHGGTEADCERIAPAFVHEGFEHPLR